MESNGDSEIIKKKFEDQLGYTLADYEKGKIWRESNNVRRPDGSNYSLLKTDIFEFGRYGVGLYLYMLYIKYIIIAFSIMSFIAIPSIISNYKGKFYESQDVSILGYTMLGNQNGFEGGTTLTNGINAYKDDDTERKMVIYSDLANTIFFFFFIYYLKYVCSVAIKDALFKTQTASDYTLYITGLPNEYQTEK